MKFELDIDRRNLSDETLLNDLAEVAGRLRTKSPTADQYTEHGQFNASTLIRRFRGWRPALIKAGLAPAHHNGGVDPQEVVSVNWWKRSERVTLRRDHYAATCVRPSIS